MIHQKRFLQLRFLFYFLVRSQLFNFAIQPLTCCEAWTLNRTVTRSINGFNSRCLHIMKGEHYRETATAPAYDLVLAVRRRSLRYLGHVLRMPADKMVRWALMALVSDSVMYPSGSLFSDCQGVALPQLVAMAANRAMWRAKVASLS